MVNVQTVGSAVGIGVVAVVAAGAASSYATVFTGLASLAVDGLPGALAPAVATVLGALDFTPKRDFLMSTRAVAPPVGAVPGKVCREGADMTTSPVWASNRVININWRSGLPTSSQGSHTL